VTRALVAVVLALACTAGPAAAGEPEPTSPSYDVALRGSDHGRRWSGRETISLSNPGAAPLARIWMRLWGNGGHGCRRPRPVRISKVVGAAMGEPAVFCTAVPLDLHAPLAPGDRGTIAFHVDIRAPRRPGRFGSRRGVALFSNAIPVLAHLEGGVFRLDRYFAGGEAWTYPAASWTVWLHPPKGVEVAAPGAHLLPGEHELLSARDFSFAAGRLRSLRRVVDGLTVTAWDVRSKRGGRLRKALRIARRRLPRLAALFGPYGWDRLQIVLTRGFAMEHTGLVMSPAIDYVLTHELAHEWWYALISNDQAAAPWLDEAFATYAEEAAGAQKQPWCRAPGFRTDLVTQGTAYFRAHDDFGYDAVYYDGACLLDLLRERMGHGVFAEALRAYALANRYGWSTAAKFRAAMDAASPVPLDDLWTLYRVS
jgi:peptidase M1-like protein